MRLVRLIPSAPWELDSDRIYAARMIPGAARRGGWVLQRNICGFVNHVLVRAGTVVLPGRVEERST